MSCPPKLTEPMEVFEENWWQLMIDQYNTISGVLSGEFTAGLCSLPLPSCSFLAVCSRAYGSSRSAFIASTGWTLAMTLDCSSHDNNTINTVLDSRYYYYLLCSCCVFVWRKCRMLMNSGLASWSRHPCSLLSRAMWALGSLAPTLTDIPRHPSLLAH